jgi:hypothetical protein
MNLLLRPTVIAGETKPNDYCVIQESRGIGRIRLAEERSWQGTVWTWSVNPPLPIPSCATDRPKAWKPPRASLKALGSGSTQD